MSYDFINTAYLLQGLLLGFAYAMPLGTQNIYVITTTLQSSKNISFFTAFVVSIIDISLSLACFFCLGKLLTFHPLLNSSLLIIGSIFLFYISLKLFFFNPEIFKEKNTASKNYLKIIRDLFILTWFNPQALIDGSILFGAINASLPLDGKLFFIFGMCSASFFWFFTLTFSIIFFKKFINNKIFAVINKSCAILLIFFSLQLIYKFFY